MVRQGDNLCVRYLNGPTVAWYRCTRNAMKDTSALAASAREVTFADFGHDLDD